MALQDSYILGSDDIIAEAVADELCRSLSNLGFVNPDESAIREHGRITGKAGDLSYWWDDIFLFRTEALITGDGIRITHENEV
jgi:hypothetical protein